MVLFFGGILSALIAFFAALAYNNGNKFCPKIYRKEIINLDFNPAFMNFNDVSNNANLIITSFFNVKFDISQTPPQPPRPVVLKPDLVAKIALGKKGGFAGQPVEVITDPPPLFGPPKTVWPNEALPAPQGVFPFQALIIAQGFHPAAFPGRLTAIDLSTLTEYVIQQSKEAPDGSPWFYHNVVFLDVDGDSLLDIITVRSSFRIGRFPNPPSGQLVWFKNPGSESLASDTPWDETILYSGFDGPDIYLEMHDFDGDGIDEIIATHFFTGSKISIYGAPEGGNWKDVDATNANAPQVRKVDISNDQGKPFSIEIVDLNGDGQVDILATNHQEDNCTFPALINGKVYALEQPSDGNLFLGGAWKTRVLLDGIFPQPSAPGSMVSRLAPGDAQTFYPTRRMEEDKSIRPWIVVGGDEAGKVWILRPVRQKGSSTSEGAWKYSAAIIFDINDEYGPGTTQTEIPEKPLITISTIGKVAVRYDEEGINGVAELYIPVFEGQQIHVFSFRRGTSQKCLEDEKLDCPPVLPPFGFRSKWAEDMEW